MSGFWEVEILDSKNIIAYKMMEKDMTCRGYQYELGKIHRTESARLCSHGFHACLNPLDCFYYYNNSKRDKRMFKVELLGYIEGDDRKLVTDRIRILEEVDIESTVLKEIEKYETDHGELSRSICMLLEMDMKMPESLILKFKDRLNWKNMSKYQDLSEEMIEEFRDSVNWGYISIYQTLSEEFIEKYKYRVDWYYICKHQKLSEEFILRNKHFVCWQPLIKYQTKTKKIVEAYAKRFYYDKSAPKSVKTKIETLCAEFDVHIEEIREELETENPWLFEIARRRYI